MRAESVVSLSYGNSEDESYKDWIYDLGGDPSGILKSFNSLSIANI